MSFINNSYANGAVKHVDKRDDSITVDQAFTIKSCVF